MNEQRRIEVTHSERRFRTPGFIGQLIVPRSARRRGVQRHRGESIGAMMLRLQRPQ